MTEPKGPMIPWVTALMKIDHLGTKAGLRFKPTARPLKRKRSREKQLQKRDQYWVRRDPKRKELEEPKMVKIISQHLRKNRNPDAR
jgi:hypothetical protein